MNNPPTETVNVDFWADRIAALIKLAEHYGMTVEITGGELVVSRQVSDVFVAQTEVQWRAAPPAAVPAGLVAVPPTTTDRDRIAEAIRAAACPGDCGNTEEECAKERIQPFVWHHGRLAVVEGTPEQFAAAVLAVLPAGSEDTTTTRADVYRKLADQQTQLAVADDLARRRDLATARRQLVKELRRLAAETQPSEAESEAHPPTHTWTVESPRRDTWASWGATYEEREWAQERCESAIKNAPQRPFRLVRATTTYTVEAEHQPAAASAGVQTDEETSHG